MKRYRQSVEDILKQLSVLESVWKDEFAEAVIQKFTKIQTKPHYSRDDILSLLDINDGIYEEHPPKERFDVALTSVRLLLDMSKDEFLYELRNQLGKGGIGINRIRNERETFLNVLEKMGLSRAISDLINRPVSWMDLIIERLKSGRGSAIKGQNRGREIENFVEEIVREIFFDQGYSIRCRFTGASGLSTEKCDFAIPSAEDPAILIEAKGYGATGSKQTDVLGDITRIVQEKRHDTDFILVTDGITWKVREGDLRKLVELQNQGKIAKIYTKSMANELRKDLLQLKNEHEL